MKVSSYPPSDCRVSGHTYSEIQLKPYEHLIPKPDKAKMCLGCNRTLIHVNGVWVEPPKKPVKRKSVEIDPAQMSLF